MVYADEERADERFAGVRDHQEPIVTVDQIKVVSRMTKPQLAQWLADHGTVYPSVAEMARGWSKDELVNSALERMGF